MLSETMNMSGREQYLTTCMVPHFRASGRPCPAQAWTQARDTLRHATVALQFSLIIISSLQSQYGNFMSCTLRNIEEWISLGAQCHEPLLLPDSQHIHRTSVAREAVKTNLRNISGDFSEENSGNVPAPTTNVHLGLQFLDAALMTPPIMPRPAFSWLHRHMC